LNLVQLAMPPTNPSEHSGTFDKVVTWSAAFSLATAAGFLASVRQVHPTVQFRFSFATVAAFLAAGIFTFTLFRIIFREKDEGAPGTSNSPRKMLILFSIVSALVLIVSVATALRNLPSSSQVDFVIGTTAGIAAVTGFAWIAWKILRFLEAEDEENTRKEREANRSEQ
jgi:hypothetical protein